MRVGLVSHAARMSGAEIAILDLAEALLDETSVRPKVIVLEQGPLVAAAQERAIPVIVVPISPGVLARRRHAALKRPLRTTLATLYGARHLADVVRQERLDLLHTNSLKAHVVGALASRWARVPCLWHLRDFVGPPHVAPAEARLLRATGRLADAVFAVSGACAEAFGGRVDGVLPSGVVTSRYASIPALPEALPEPLVIGAIGRLSPWKGHHVLVAAVRELASAGVHVRVLFAGEALFGEDDYARELRNDAAGLDCQFLGHVADVRDVLAGSHLVVHTSIWPEPFGKVIVEALAASRPVIATDLGGPREILSDPAFRSWLVPPNDPVALADRILRLIGDWPGTVATATHGPRLARQFDVREVAAQTAGIYESILRSAAFPHHDGPGAPSATVTHLNGSALAVEQGPGGAQELRDGSEPRPHGRIEDIRVKRLRRRA